MSQHNARMEDKKFCGDKEISCCDIFQEQQRMIILLQQSIYVATQDTHVTTITSQLQHNYVVTLSNYVAIESMKKAQNYIATITASHDKSWGTKMKTMSQ